jgi:hypothetical protein
MIPAGNGLLGGGITFAEIPTHTFFLDVYGNVCYGYTDGLKAMEQDIYLILRTERYEHAIFSWNYGSEFEDLFGMPVSWVIPEVKRRITEALLQDTRITAVDGFEFAAASAAFPVPAGTFNQTSAQSAARRGVLTVRFTAHTIFGDVQGVREVDF